MEGRPPSSPTAAAPSKGAESSGGKKGGIFKKLKEKRSKREKHTSLDQRKLLAQWVSHGDQPLPLPPKKRRRNRPAKRRQMLSNSMINQSRSESVSSREDKEGAINSPRDKKCSWSHSHLNKVSMDRDQSGGDDFQSMFSHSGSVTFSPMETSCHPREGGGGGTLQICHSWP